MTGDAAPDPAPAPSVHVRALLTWLVIFPEVAIVNLFLSPGVGLGEIVGRSLIVTLVVIPPAVYLFVPLLLRLWTRTARRRDAGIGR